MPILYQPKISRLRVRRYPTIDFTAMNAATAATTSPTAGATQPNIGMISGPAFTPS